MTASPRDWVDWHAAYDEPDSTLARRLAVVRQRFTEALDAAPPGPIRVVSMCAGQGRDVIVPLAGHARRADVTARLVELDPRNAAAAQAAAAAEGLAQVEVVRADAGHTDSYLGAVPAEIVLACGVFGNVSDVDIRRTVEAMPGFTAPGGVVIWTRHRGEPDAVPAICRWFEAAGFAEVWVSEKKEGYGVGVHRLVGEPAALPLGQLLFTFTEPPRV